MAEDWCEVCSGVTFEGLCLCHAHLEQWLRSPERRALPSLDDQEAYDRALTKFVERLARSREAQA